MELSMVCDGKKNYSDNKSDTLINPVVDELVNSNWNMDYFSNGDISGTSTKEA